MISRAILLLLVLGGLAPPATAAGRTITVTVDKKGSIRIPAATLKQLGVKPDRSGSLWIQFPMPAAEVPKLRPPQSARSFPATLPARVLVNVDKGQVVFARTRVGAKSHVPGAPGTRYLASGSGNELILRTP